MGERTADSGRAVAGAVRRAEWHECGAAWLSRSNGCGSEGRMRIPVNLASEPFRRDRPMIVASSVVGVLLSVLLVVLVYLAMAERDRAAEARAAIDKMQRQMDGFAREE